VIVSVFHGMSPRQHKVCRLSAALEPKGAQILSKPNGRQHDLAKSRPVRLRSLTTEPAGESESLPPAADGDALWARGPGAHQIASRVSAKLPFGVEIVQPRSLANRFPVLPSRGDRAANTGHLARSGHNSVRPHRLRSAARCRRLHQRSTGFLEDIRRNGPGCELGGSDGRRIHPMAKHGTEKLVVLIACSRKGGIGQSHSDDEECNAELLNCRLHGSTPFVPFVHLDVWSATGVPPLLASYFNWLLGVRAKPHLKKLSAGMISRQTPARNHGKQLVARRPIS